MQNLWHVGALSNSSLGLQLNFTHERGSTCVRAVKSVPELLCLQLNNELFSLQIGLGSQGVKCVKDAGTRTIIKLYPGEPRGNC